MQYFFANYILNTKTQKLYKRGTLLESDNSILEMSCCLPVSFWKDISKMSAIKFVALKIPFSRGYSITTWNGRGRGSVEGPRLVIWQLDTGYHVKWMSTIFHEKEGGGKIWVKFGPRSCWRKIYWMTSLKDSFCDKYTMRIYSAM